MDKGVRTSGKHLVDAGVSVTRNKKVQLYVREPAMFNKQKKEPKEPTILVLPIAVVQLKHQLGRMSRGVGQGVKGAHEVQEEMGDGEVRGLGKHRKAPCIFTCA